MANSISTSISTLEEMGMMMVMDDHLHLHLHLRRDGDDNGDANFTSSKYGDGYRYEKHYEWSNSFFWQDDHGYLYLKTAWPIPLLKERMVIQLLVSLYIQGKISY